MREHSTHQDRVSAMLSKQRQNYSHNLQRSVFFHQKGAPNLLLHRSERKRLWEAFVEEFLSTFLSGEVWKKKDRKTDNVSRRQVPASENFWPECSPKRKIYSLRKTSQNSRVVRKNAHKNANSQTWIWRLLADNHAGLIVATAEFPCLGVVWNGR